MNKQMRGHDAPFPFRHKKMVAALAVISLGVTAHDVYAMVYGSSQQNIDLNAGDTINSADNRPAYSITDNSYTAAGNNTIANTTVGQKAIAIENIGGSVASLTSAGPLTVQTTGVGATALSVVGHRIGTNAATFVSNGDYTSVSSGAGSTGIDVHNSLDRETAASAQFNGDTDVTVTQGGMGAYGITVYSQGKLQSIQSLIVQTTDADGLHVYRSGVVNLSGHVDITAQGNSSTFSGAKAVGVVIGRSGQFTLAGDGTSTITSDGVGVIVGAADSTNGGTTANATLSSVGVVTATDGADGIQLDATGFGGATLSTDNVQIGTVGNNAAGVHMLSTSKPTSKAMLSNSTIQTAGENSYGLFAAGQGTISATGSTIKTQGIGAHGVELNGTGTVTLDSTSLSTQNDGAFGLDLKSGTITTANGVSIETHGNNADGIVYEPSAANSVSATVGSDTSVSVHGANSNGLSVRGANAALTLDGSALSPGNIQVDAGGGALLEAEQGGTLTINGSAQFSQATGALEAVNGADPSVWGVKAGDNGTVVLGGNVATNGNGVWATSTGKVFFNEQSSAADAVVRVDGTVDASGHTGDLSIGYLDGGGTVEMGNNNLNLGGNQPMASSYEYTGAINGDGNLTKAGTNTQILNGNAAFNFSGDVYLNGGVLEITNINDPANFTETFHVGDGWLDLSNTTAQFDPSNPGSATNWGVHLVDEHGRGGVIGQNDKLEITSGDWGFQVGSGSNPNGKGIYVDKTGADKASLSGHNDYIGSTWIEGGILEVTEDDNLGDTSAEREIKLMGGSLEIGASPVSIGGPASTGFASSRDVQLYADGSVIVDSGVNATLGTVTDALSANDGQQLTKEGEGSLTFQSANLRKGLVLKAGSLAIDGGMINAGASGSAIAAAGNTNMSVSGMIVTSDSNVYEQTSAGQNTFTAKSGSVLTGNIEVAGAGASTNATFSGGTQLTGAANATNGGQLNLTLADANTTWNMNGDSSVDALTNNGRIEIAPPVNPSADPSQYKTLSVGGNYTADNGTVRMNAFLNAGGPTAPQAADHLTIKGKVTGQTTLDVNTAGPGANTNIGDDHQFHADEGISLVQVGGTAAADSFKLGGVGYVTGTNGNIYPYWLFGYGPTSQFGAAADGEGWDYRLQTAYIDENGNLVPGTLGQPGDGHPAVVPQLTSYLSAAPALQRYGAMVLGNLHQRLGEIRQSDFNGNGNGNGQNGEAFARVIGETGNYHSNIAWKDYGYDASQQSAGVQFGGEVLHYARNDQDLRFGVAATLGSTTVNPSTAAVEASRLSVVGQSAALTATWQNRAGWYVDAILAGDFYRGNVNVAGSGIGDVSGYGLDVSLEGGKTIELANGLEIEPRVQLTSQSLHLREKTDRDGIDVNPGNSHFWTSTFGARFAYPIKSKVTWTPYAWIGYSYTWTSSGSPTLSGVAFPGSSIGGAVQLTLGASGQVTKNLQVYGELAGQSRINGYGHSALTGSLGLRYQF